MQAVLLLLLLVLAISSQLKEAIFCRDEETHSIHSTLEPNSVLPIAGLLGCIEWSRRHGEEKQHELIGMTVNHWAALFIYRQPSSRLHVSYTY